MLQAVNTDIFNPLVPEAQKCVEIFHYTLQIKSVKVS